MVTTDGPLPRCRECGMFTQRPDTHPTTTTCRQLQVQRCHEHLQDLQVAAGDVFFLVGGCPIKRVPTFKYLGRVLDEAEDNTKCIKVQLKQDWSRWWRVLTVLKRQGANAQIMARFYLAVVQAILLYRADSWTITKQNLAKLSVFHWRAVRHIMGKHIRKLVDGTWSYPNHEELLRECCLLPIEAYIARRRGTLKNIWQSSNWGCWRRRMRWARLVETNGKCSGGDRSAYLGRRCKN